MICPVIIFAEIPAIYPVIISKMNGKLVPLAVSALYALITFKGQEKPKHTSITVSKIDPIINLLYVCFVYVASLAYIRKKKHFMKNTNITYKKNSFFLLSKLFWKDGKIENKLFL